jgi:hypothetical protein
MSSALAIDDKYGELFADAVARAGLRVRVVAAESAYGATGHVLRAVVAVDDIADWTLRYAVLEEGRSLEQAWDITVICLFRQTVAPDEA